MAPAAPPAFLMCHSRGGWRGLTGGLTIVAPHAEEVPATVCRRRRCRRHTVAVTPNRCPPVTDASLTGQDVGSVAAP